MTGAIEARLRERGITLPPPTPPAADYVPFVVSGSLVFVAGQLPMRDGAVAISGKLGAEVSLSDGQAAARLCGLNLLAQAAAAADGDLDRIARCVKLGGFVNATPDFVDHPKVLNGASGLMSEVLGDAGRHARFAMGAASLPFDAAVEVDGIFELR
ncbi:MAG: RidA family protein [Proteobacteria bacterium]|nr:RidA family protein [Pseudomonadota bacterium]MDA1132792.1 RidA family protein [Pseudomonadota bacterium]